jgi:hypothetical protein
VRARDDGVDIIGMHNDGYIDEITHRCGNVILAWGAHPLVDARAWKLFAILAGYDVLCWGETKGGYPAHPLMLAYDTPLVRYPASRGSP